MNKITEAILRGLLLLFFLPAAAFAADSWFTRPFGSGGTVNDGSSYAEAWLGLGAVDWGVIQPGDTLYVCGLHNGGTIGVGDYYLTVTVSGISASQPTIVDGACPTGLAPPSNMDAGRILSSALTITGGWINPVDGVYSRAGSGCSYNFINEDATTYLTRIPRDSVDQDLPAIPYIDWPAGSFFQGNLACGGDRTLYYKPTSGLPNNHTLYISNGNVPILRVIDVDDVHIKNLTVENGHRGEGIIQINNANGIRVENSTFSWGQIAIAIQNNSDYGRLTNNTIHDSRNGIYFTSISTDTLDSQDNWLVSDNHIYDINGHFDSHCIGIQTGSDNQFIYNHLHDCEGSGITFYNWGSGHQIKNNIVMYNNIHDINDVGLGTGNQRGIEYQITNCPQHPDDTIGNVVAYNLIADVDNEAIFNMSSAPTTPDDYSWSFFNNTVVGAGYGFWWTDAASYGELPGGTLDCTDTNRIQSLSNVGFRAQNNIFADITTNFMMPQRLNLSGQDTDHTGIVTSNNLYYSSSGTGNFIWQAKEDSGLEDNCDTVNGSYDSGVNACTVDNLADYQFLSGKEQSSLATDPLMVDPTNSNPANADYHLLSNSPAINAGTDVGQPADYAGTPIFALPEIGAYEKDSDYDSDSVPDSTDNCPLLTNLNQQDFDGDGQGDVCDNDMDNDGLSNDNEATEGTNPLNPDTDGDGYGDSTEVSLGSNPLDSNSTPVIVADGDINLDGQVNVADILLGTRALLALTTLTAEQIAHGDFRPTPAGDGQITLGDLFILTRTALGLP